MLDRRLVRDALGTLDSLPGPASLAAGGVLELPKSLYFRRFYSVEATPTAIVFPIGGSTEFQYLGDEAPFVIRSLQYLALWNYPADPNLIPPLPAFSTGCGFVLRFSDGRSLALPASAPGFVNSASRVDLTGGVRSGGIVLRPGDRVGVTFDPYYGPGVGLYAPPLLSASILFNGVLLCQPDSAFQPRPRPAFSEGLRALFTANQNIMAPQTARGFQCYPETPAGYRDEPLTVISPVVSVQLQGGGGLDPMSPEVSGIVQLPGGGDFVWRGLDWLITNVVGWGADPINPALGIPTNCAARIRTMNGESLSSDLVDLYAMSGPLLNEVVLPSGSRIFIDVAVEWCDGSGAVNDMITSLRLVLQGVRRVKI
jgi:hypothetical protein